MTYAALALATVVCHKRVAIFGVDRDQMRVEGAHEERIT